MRFSGFTKIEIATTGGSLSSPDVIIEEDHILGDTAFEVEENEDQTDVQGESPHSGQFANVTIQSNDFSARAQLVTFRTSDPEKRVDIRGTFPDGDSITVEGVRAKTMLQPVAGEKGQVNGWVMESRGYTKGVWDFD